MYRYKRGINDIGKLGKTSLLLSNNNNRICSLNADFAAHRLYDGLYIKENEVLVENLIEEIEIKNKLYKMANIETSTINISNDEYIEYVDLNENEIRYNVDLFNYTKKITFDLDNDIEIVTYTIENKNDCSVKFKVCPLVTYRNIHTTKNSQFLRFSQRNIESGVVVNLSVHDNVNVIIASDELTYVKDVEYVNNVKHYITSEELEKKVSVEDLFIPGILETAIPKNSTKVINVIISTNEVDIKKYDVKEAIKKYNENRYKIINTIPEEYVELKDLVTGIDNLNLRNTMICSFPYTIDLENLYKREETTLNGLLKYVEVLTDYVRAIEGRYVILGKEKESMFAIDYVRNIIEDIDKLQIQNEKFTFEYLKLKLWYIESVYKVVSNNLNLLGEQRVDFVRKLIYELMKADNQKYILQNIETISLFLNDVKIARHVFNKYKIEDESLYETENDIAMLIEKEYFVPEKKCMKEFLNKNIVKPNIGMLYTLSLSFPCVVGDISIKLLDTIFKELYTPYGLRTKSKSDINSDGFIYPKYLAHFIKANLRQNGITRASKKIAYNLVKEIIMDISKKVNGGVPYVYSEKGIKIDEISYDLLTNAEMIRLYDMLS